MDVSIGTKRKEICLSSESLGVSKFLGTIHAFPSVLENSLDTWKRKEEFERWTELKTRLTAKPVLPNLHEVFNDIKYLSVIINACVYQEVMSTN